MMWDFRSTDPEIHAAAVRMAVACRRIIQACLREEERMEADRQFYIAIREEMEKLCGMQ